MRVRSVRVFIRIARTLVLLIFVVSDVTENAEARAEIDLAAVLFARRLLLSLEAQRFVTGARVPVFQNDVMTVRRERAENSLLWELLVDETTTVSVWTLTGLGERPADLGLVLWMTYDAT